MAVFLQIKKQHHYYSIMSKRILIISILLTTALVWTSCNEGFNDPNPKSIVNEDVDFFAPDLKLISPKDSQLYASPNLPIQIEISDTFNLKSIAVDIASFNKPAPGFSVIYKPLSRSFVIDTTYVANISDTVDLQMLIVASDSTGNVLSKSVKFKMFKP